MTKPIYFRAFLAPPKSDSDAYVSYDITPTWCNLKIHDCHRGINIAFDQTAGRTRKYKKFKKIMLKFFEQMDKMLGLEEVDAD